MVIIQLKGVDQEQFGEKVVSDDGVTLKVRAKFKDRTDVVDTYPLANVLRYREIPDVTQN